VVAATRVLGSTGTAVSCGVNATGALAVEALAFASERVAGVGFAGGAAPTGVAAASGWSPFTERVLIFRGSLLASVPLRRLPAAER